MNTDPDLQIFLLAKALGSVSGTILSLVFMPPVNRRELFRRAVASLIGGMIFAPVVRGFFGWPAEFEYRVAGATIAAFGIWSAMGVGYKLIRAYKAKNED